MLNLGRSRSYYNHTHPGAAAIVRRVETAGGGIWTAGSVVSPKAFGRRTLSFPVSSAAS